MSGHYLTIDHLNTKELTRLFGKIRISKTSFYKNIPCWEWTGYTDNGYGRFGYKGNAMSTHRIMYAWLIAPIPQGVSKTTPQLDHLCRNRACCNPAHLELVLPRINSLRGAGIQVTNFLKTHCTQGHEFTPENTYLSKRGRSCRTCHLQSSKARHARQNQDATFVARRRENALKRYHRQAASPEWRAAENAKKRARAKKKQEQA